MRKSHFILLSLLLIFAVGCKSKPKTGNQKPVTVTVLEVQARTIPADFEYVGFAESSHPVEIRARVEGYLESIAYVEGAHVSVGDLLFQIDPRPFQAVVAQNEAELKQQEAILWNAVRTRERLDPLYKQNAASLRDLDNAIAHELESEATVEAAKANLEKAQLNLAYTTITSPINGMASKARFREGALIAPGGNDGLLTTVSVLDPIWVYFSVSSSDLLKAQNEVSKGLLKYPDDMNFKVELILADGSTFPYTGQVNFTAPTLNQNTGTMNIRATFSNPRGALLPGQFVRAKVTGAVHPNAIAVPQKALLQGRSGMFVYLVNDKDEAVVQYVVPGDWAGDDWVINSGLKPGDRVITEGINKVQPEWPLNITKTEKQ